MTRAIATALAMCLLGTAAYAQQRAADGTVLIRVMGDVSVALLDPSGAAAREAEIRDASVGTGSGMVVTPTGYIVTNHHVVAGGEMRGRLRGVPATMTISVRRVEVRFPPDPRGGQAGGRFEATVVASDPDLDLAILSIAGNDFPYVPLGDSDALQSGHAVSVIGYPLGSQLDVGRPAGEDEALAPAMGSGIVSALRRAADNSVRYVQTTAPLNRGDSGGPLLDRHGFSVGVVQMKLTDAESIGFAIPINLVKEYLARHGLDSQLAATRLTLGGLFEAREKLIRLQVPDGFQDVGPSRLGVDSGSSLPGVALRIDRVAATWTAERLADELRAGRAFERHRFPRGDAPVVEENVLRGQASGRADGEALRLLYAIVDLGDEKVVARYVGSAEQIAFNESVLTQSIESLAVASMLSAQRDSADEPRWARASPPVLADLVTVMPAAWIVEDGLPRACTGTAPQGGGVLLSPRDDFRVSFRIARHETALDVKQAIAACSRSRTASQDEYRYGFSAFGVDYTVAGRFQPSGSGTLQAEVVAPTRAFEGAHAIFSQWLGEIWR